MQISLSQLSRRQDGAALLEVLVTLAIFGLAAGAIGFSFPLLRGKNSSLVLETRLAAFIAAVSLESRRLQIPVRAIFDGRSFTTTPYIGPALDIAALNTRLVLVSAAELSDAGGASIMFMPDGTSTGGSFLIEDGATVRRLDVIWVNSRIVRHGG